MGKWLVVLMLLAVPLWAQPINPATFAFEPSEDADVTGYRLELVSIATNAVVQTVDLGKPTPQPTGEIRVDLAAAIGALPPQAYFARAVAIRAGMASEPSNRVDFIRQAAPATDCTALVTRIYLEELCRQPDAAGLKAWVTSCQAGQTEAAIRGAFRSSAEYARVSHPCTTVPPVPTVPAVPPPPSPDPALAEIATLKARIAVLEAAIKAAQTALTVPVVP